MQGAGLNDEGAYLSTQLRSEGTATKQITKITSIWGISSAGRAPALHAGGQGFEPLILHHLESEFRLGFELYLEN